MRIWNSIRGDSDELFNKKCNQGVTFKPEGGLWYAFDDEWIKWARYQRPHKLGANNFVIDVDPAKIITLNSADDIYAFTSKYGVKEFGTVLIDWHKVVQDTGGIELGYFELPMKGAEWIHAYDMRSGCIWDKSALRSARLCTAKELKMLGI